MGRLGDGVNGMDDEEKNHQAKAGKAAGVSGKAAAAEGTAAAEKAATAEKAAGAADEAAAGGNAAGATGGGSAAEGGQAPVNPALAAARAALAALDKANAESESNRDELAAAWQALSTLGEEHGGGPVGEDAPRAPGGRGRTTRVSDTEWALPVVDAPPTQYDVYPDPAPGSGPDAGPQPGAPAPEPERAASRPGGGGRTAAARPRLTGDPDADWAAPVLDAPPAPPVDEAATYASDEADGADGADGTARAAYAAGDQAPRVAEAREPGGGEALFDVRRPAPDAPGSTARGFAASARFDDAREPDESVLAAVRDVLAAGGAPARLADQAVVSLGPDAAVLLTEDPWNLLALPGISPQQADLFAQAGAGGPADSDEPRRTRALVLWTLAGAARDSGHTAVEVEAVVSALEGLGVRDAPGAVRAAYDAGRIMAFAERPPSVESADEDFDGADGGDFDEEYDEGFDDVGPGGFEDPFEGPSDRLLVALERHALAEESIADAVLRLISTAGVADDGTGFGGGSGGGADLGEALRGAAVALYVTGAGEDPPAAALEVAGRAAKSARVVVASPTVDGRMRLATAVPGEVPGPVTVHGLLVGTEGPGRTPEGLLDLDLLVVAESHLLDVQTAASLLEAVPDGGRVVLCGDPDELEPSAPGQVFADLVASGALPVVASRAQAPGVLGSLAAAVRGGTLPPVESPDREVVLVGARAAAEAVHRCVQLVADSIPRALGIPAEDVLVVTPADGGSAGTTALNAALKARLNPGPGQYAGFDIGDRVVRVPAPRTTGLVEGRVVAAGPEGLAVAYRDDPDAPVTVPRARIGELRHGWAVTVRQALGVRRPGVVAMLPGDAGPLVTRALVYTAFTRARRHLSVVYPVGGTLPQAVARPGGSVRTTRLAAALREAAAEAGFEVRDGA
ncbi:AAA family ATPase [Streptodolium elevatio]